MNWLNQTLPKKREKNLVIMRSADYSLTFASKLLRSPWSKTAFMLKLTQLNAFG